MDHEAPYEEIGPTRALTSCDKESPKSVPPAIKRLIGELGLRYRPSAQGDLEAHAAAIALLARDLADVPPAYLERAIRKWAVTRDFMPRASELVRMAQELQQADDGAPKGKPVDMAARRNAQLRAEGNFSLHWYYDQSGQIKLETVTEQAARHKHAEQFS